MKCNIERISQFIENDKIDQDIRDFVYKVYKKSFQDYTDDSIKFFFMDFGFYELTKEDEDDYDTTDEDHQVLDLYKLLKMNSKFRKLILKPLYKYIIGEGTSTFFDDFLAESKLINQYEKWKKVRRKNKLLALNDLNINE